MAKKKGRNAKLEAGTEAAPNASTLADRTDGELVALDGDEAHVLHDDNGTRRVLTYSRLRSGDRDSVWIVTGTTMKIPCGQTGD